MLIHNIIKINYVRDGYLPNHPYHLISDREMFDAFLTRRARSGIVGYFADKYPCVDLSLKLEYEALIDAICYHIDAYLDDKTGTKKVPDWVYSYMIGSTVSVDSDLLDRHDLLVLMNLDNVEDEITKEVCENCLEISRDWIKKLPKDKADHRPPTMFGEPHVIKALRLLNTGM